MTVEVRGLVATSDGPGRYDSILCCQLRRQYSLNFLVPSIRSFDSLNNLLYKQKNPVEGVYCLYWHSRRESLALSLSLADRPGRYDSILCCQLRRQCSLNFLVPSIRPFDSLNNLVCKQKTPLKGFVVCIGVPGGSRTHGLPLRRRTLYPTELRKLKCLFRFRITIIICKHRFVKRIRFFTHSSSPA